MFNIIIKKVLPMNGRFSASKVSPFVRLLPFTASVRLKYSLIKL